MDYPFHGRKRSWAAVGVIIIGFLVGGISLTLGPLWWLFFLGAGIAAIGGLSAVFSDVMSDVVLDEPRVVEEVLDYSTIGRENQRVRGGVHGETSTKPTSADPTRNAHG